ncbi:MAG TPA: hypothetical protein VFQ80_04385 [Thermomicrobiales bacterium]|nr:hypothetical protein [Thermomicrobiales bacterium]
MEDETDRGRDERPARALERTIAGSGASFGDDLRRGRGAALPCLLTALLAFALTRFRLPIRTGDVPVALLLIVLAQAIGCATTRGGQPERARHWGMALIATTLVLPAIALQAAFSREPFVSLGRGSAAGLLWMTLAALAVLLGAFGLACGLAAAAPADGSLLFIPAAAVVPAVAAAPLDLNEQDVLSALVVAALVAGLAIGGGTILPESYRPPVGAIALGGEFVLLWALRRSPYFAPEHGLIVPVLAALLLATTVVALVLAPIGALAARRFAATMDGGFAAGVGDRTPFRPNRRPSLTPRRNRRR